MLNHGNNSISHMVTQVGLVAEESPMDQPEGNKCSRTQLPTLGVSANMDSPIVSRESLDFPLSSTSVDLREENSTHNAIIPNEILHCVTDEMNTRLTRVFTKEK
ncbi:hypothetical protein V6N12_035258, partial [Hibiscus sabdariffa]